MAGQGSKGRQATKGGGKRHTKRKSSDTLEGLTVAAIRRLARRGGVRRISSDIYPQVRAAMKQFLNEVIKDTIVFTESAQRVTVLVSDVVYALKRHGKTIYGYSSM